MLRRSRGLLGSRALANPQGPIGQFPAGGVATRRSLVPAFLSATPTGASSLSFFTREMHALPSKYSRDFPVAFICSALRRFRLREVRNFETVSRKEGPERFRKRVDCTVCRCRTLLKTERKRDKRSVLFTAFKAIVSDHKPYPLNIVIQFVFSFALSPLTFKVSSHVGFSNFNRNPAAMVRGLSFQLLGFRGQRIRNSWSS